MFDVTFSTKLSGGPLLIDKGDVNTAAMVDVLIVRLGATIVVAASSDVCVMYVVSVGRLVLFSNVNVVVICDFVRAFSDVGLIDGVSVVAVALT